MKVLILTTKPPWPPHDGGAVATMRCIEGLADNGAEVSVLAMKTHKHASSDLFETVIPSKIRSFKTVHVGTEIKRTGLALNLLFSRKPYDLARFYSGEFIRQLKEILEKESFDMIQCEGLVFMQYLDKIRGMCHVPVVLRAHNIEHRIRLMMAQQARKWLYKLYLKNLAGRIKRQEIMAARSFDAVIPVSITDKQWFDAHSMGKPVFLSEPGIERAVSHVPDEGHRVGFIGALDWKPNADGLIWFISQVWPYVSDRLPSATFHIAGRNTPEELRPRLTGKNIFFRGEVADAASFTSAMTVMIAPLFAGSGIRIKILEAMSLGRVVIATPVAAEGLPVTSDREILIADDNLRFTSHLLKALNEPVLRSEITEAATEMITKHFNNYELTGKLLAFYTELCHGC